MKTKFSSLVSVKKNTMQKSEKVLQQANSDLYKAEESLEDACSLIYNLHTPEHGKISDFLSHRALLDSQRMVIRQNEERVLFAQEATDKAKQQLKIDTIEYEKFHYLEIQEIKKILQKQKLQEAKELDEVALVTFETNSRKGSIK